MKEKRFDDKIKNLVNSVEETVGSDVWHNIESGLIRRRREVFLRTVSYIAVAASLVIGTFLIVPKAEEKPVYLLTEVKSSEIIEIDVQESTGELKKEDFYVKKKPSRRIADISQAKKSIQQNLNPESAQELVQGSKLHLLQQSEQRSTKESLTEEIKKEASNKEPQKKEYKTISEQIDEMSYLAMNEEVKKPKRKIGLAILSNMNAGKSLSEKESSFPNFTSGQGSSLNYGIVPISAINNSWPVTVGAQLKIGFGKKFGVGIGANYTYLHSKYEAIIDGRDQGMVEQKLHYIGVPLNLYYNIIQTKSMVFYASAGGMLEKGLQANYDIVNTFSGNETNRKEGISGIQWSVNVGVGFEYKFIDLMGIYIDPSLSYFFEGEQPYSVRTSEPLQFGLEIGFRFHL